MHRKFLFLLFTFFLSIPLFAQLEVKEDSFKEVAGFVNINTEIMYDDNDKPYAVIKVKTENMDNKQRRELKFEGDARTFIELEYKVGEIWVYISYYATYLKVSHPDFGSTEFWFPYDMKGKKGYELTIVNNPTVYNDILSRLEKLEKENTENIANNTVKDEKPNMTEKENKYHQKSSRKKGWVFRPEVGFGIIVDEIQLELEHDFIALSSYNFTTYEDNKMQAYYTSQTSTNDKVYQLFLNGGYQLNPYIYLGGGLGVNSFSKIISMPVYINPRLYINNRKCSVYIDLKAGFSINLKSNEYEGGSSTIYYSSYGYYYDGSHFQSSYSCNDFVSAVTKNKIKGYCLELGAGLEFKRSSVGLCLNIAQTYLETNITNHYYYYGNSGSNTEPPTNYNNASLTQSSKGKEWIVLLKYGYRVF